MAEFSGSVPGLLLVTILRVSWPGGSEWQGHAPEQDQQPPAIVTGQGQAGVRQGLFITIEGNTSPTPWAWTLHRRQYQPHPILVCPGQDIPEKAILACPMGGLMTRPSLACTASRPLPFPTLPTVSGLRRARSREGTPLEWLTRGIAHTA